ncbi:unnamed protein product [Arabidopsis halleri]
MLTMMMVVCVAYVKETHSHESFEREVNPMSTCHIHRVPKPSAFRSSPSTFPPKFVSLLFGFLRHRHCFDHFVKDSTPPLFVALPSMK